MPDPFPVINPLLTIPQAAFLLNVSRRTVYRLIDAGNLERVKIGRSARVTAASLNLYLKSIRRSPGPEKGGPDA
jgi:excisionase family DNA binding protein